MDEFVADMGYRSRAEIVNDAIRRFIDERKRLDRPVVEKEKNLGSKQEFKRNVVPELVH